ncbi:MAG: bifunctional 2-C-methyl-D-erythritol 4-phosphate cytidylyltransferase/2-C-methyl-D-erythritol 2,4-cyclodiphosphate synthase [Caulobacterales bacterium]|nr:bifunctional 2-C-methyl-D-erythritol 4-phosphate cytidylyltransferase/2-C-methyl-D-erythritol 2,4-cyclodiphosphate synthase [Caulobacterales bacterium]
MTAAALIVAAGRGARAGGGVPKQYRPLAGRALLAWTLEAFLSHPRVDAVRVVIAAGDRTAYDAVAETLGHRAGLLEPVTGGAERQDSVRAGLESLAGDAPDLVLIHDAARPFVTEGVISAVLDALADGPAAIAALPVADTLKRANGDADRPVIAETVPRDALWRAQTPQGFSFPAILAAHRGAIGAALTDDAAVAEHAGLPVALTPGSPDNMKITQAEDFGLAEILLARARGGAAMEYRTGQGFDVHAFAPGDHVTLCGVEVPHDHALAGHSDADVGMHALTDAILGALAAGDIGDHFPPSDAQWKGAPSRLFLAKARDLVAQAGGSLAHADVTLICERPKIGPHKDAMRTALAEILGVEASRVSVKATTTEQLGFTGRREGIAALASATIRLPA